MAELDTTVSTEAPVETETTGTDVVGADVAKLKAELAKTKAAMDKAMKEAAETKRALRAKQSAEEAAADENKKLQESLQEELNQLRKEKAVASNTARIVPFIGDNALAGKIAEGIYG